MLSEGQVKIRDLVMGPGTPYTLRGFNPFARSVRSNQSGGRPWNDGAWSGAEFLEASTVPLRIFVKGDSRSTGAFIAAYLPLMAAFDAVGDSATDVEMTFMLGGTEYLMFGRPSMVDPETEFVGTGKGPVEAAFIANNPRIYSAELFTNTANLPLTVGGLNTPFRTPVHVTGVRLGGGMSMTNSGLAKAPVRLRIDGPVAQPRLTFTNPAGDVTDLRVDFDLITGQFLEIDTSNRLVLLNGTTNRRGEVSGDFPLLTPGTSLARFNSSVFNDTALLTATWRNAW